MYKKLSHNLTVFFLAFTVAAGLVLSACGGTEVNDGSSESMAVQSTDASGDSGDTVQDPDQMLHFILYREDSPENPDFISDMQTIEERVAAYSGGNYIFRQTELEFEGTVQPGAEIWIPTESLGKQLVDASIKSYINRPIELWLGDRQGISSGYFNEDETIKLDREDILSVKIQNGCPDNIKLLDYGIESDTCLYIEFEFRDEFLKANPQIFEWENPCIAQDVKGYSVFYSISLTADKEKKRFYHIETDTDMTEGLGAAAAVVYNYTHSPLSQSFYFLYSSPIKWETGEEITGQNQTEPSMLEGEAYEYLYTMNESVCSEEDWQQAVKAVKGRLDALGVPYLFGQEFEKEHTIAIKTKPVPYLDDLMEIIMNGSSIRLHACSTYYQATPLDARYTLSQENGSCSVSIDMSQTGKDTLNELSGLCCKTGGGRIWLSAASKPLFWADVDSVISDGKLTLTGNALSGDTTFSEDDLRLFTVMKAVLSGESFNLKGDPAYRSATINFTLRETSIFDENGVLTVGYYQRFDRERAIDRIKDLIADLNPSDVVQNDAGRVHIKMPMPEEKDRIRVLAGQTGEILKKIKNDVRILGGAVLEWSEDEENTIQVICANSEYPDRGRFSLSFYTGTNIDGSFQEEFKKECAKDEFLAENIRLDIG